MPFTGEIVKIPLGKSGLSGSAAQSQIDEDELVLANNITFEDGTLRKEGGAAKYNSTAIAGAPDVIAGWDWDHDGATQRSIVLTSNGDLLKDDGAGDYTTATLKSGLTVSGIIGQFVEGGKEALANDRKLFLFSNSNAVQVLAANGATTADLATPPADWSSSSPTCGVLHENRLWGGLGHIMYYSTLTNHEDFTSAGSGTVAVFPGEGERIVAAVSFKGHLIVFKEPSGIYDIDTTSTTITEWSVDVITRKNGSLNPLTVQVVDNDVVYMDNTGNLHSVEATEEFGNFRNSSLSDVRNLSPFLRLNVNLSQLRKAQMVYYEAKREVHVALPGTGSTDNNRRLVMDLNETDKLRFRFSDRDDPHSIWLKKDSDKIPRLTMGDGSGFVWNLDQDSRSKDGSGYNGEFRTPDSDLSFAESGLGVINKNGKFLELVVEPKGNWNLDVDILWDGEITQTVPFNMGISGATLGSFVLNTDKLADEQVLNKRKRITGSGKRFGMIGSNSGDSEDFSVDKAYLHFTRGGERDIA